MKYNPAKPLHTAFLIILVVLFLPVVILLGGIYPLFGSPRETSLVMLTIKQLK